MAREIAIVHETQRQQIQRAIDHSEKKIDELVYGLYGLSGEEIEIIEIIENSGK